VILRKQASKPTLSPCGEGRDHLGGISIVLRPVVLALEEELELGSEVSDSSLVPQQRILPRHPERWIPPVDPTLLIAFADGDVEAPWLVPRLAAPQVVLAGHSLGYRPVPRCESAGCSDLDVPASQHHRQGRRVIPQDADVAVMVSTPGAPNVELKSGSTTDPPACWPPVENLDHVTEFEWLPRPQSIVRHQRPSVGRRMPHFAFAAYVAPLRSLRQEERAPETGDVAKERPALRTRLPSPLCRVSETLLLPRD
jgi:hypothetical protein